MGELVTIDKSADIAALFDLPVVDSLSSDERSLLSMLLRRDEQIDIVIPASTSADQLWESLTLCAKVFGPVNKARQILKLLIGRMLNLMQDRPELYESRGFRSFDQFMSDEKRGLPKILNISRGELYKTKSVAERNPSLPISDYREIGFSKLAALGPVTREGNSDYPAWINAAKTSTLTELREQIYRSDANIPPGSLEMDMLVLPMTKADKDEIEEFIGDPQMQAVSGSRDRAKVLVNATREARMEWLAQAQGAEGDQ